MASGELFALAEGSSMGRGQALLEVVRQGVHGLDESGGIVVADDAWRERFVEGDGGGCSPFTEKGPAIARF